MSTEEFLKLTIVILTWAFFYGLKSFEKSSQRIGMGKLRPWRSSRYEDTRRHPLMYSLFPGMWLGLFIFSKSSFNILSLEHFYALGLILFFVLNEKQKESKYLAYTFVFLALLIGPFNSSFLSLSSDWEFKVFFGTSFLILLWDCMGNRDFSVVGMSVGVIFYLSALNPGFSVGDIKELLIFFLALLLGLFFLWKLREKLILKTEGFRMYPEYQLLAYFLIYYIGRN